MPKRNNGPSTEISERVAISKRRARISELLLQGYTQRQVGNVLGMSDNDVSVIYKDLREEWCLTLEQPKNERIAQLLEQLRMGYRAAFDSYLLSKQNATETTTVRVPKRCGECKGKGTKEDSSEWCDDCGGEGRVYEETVTVRTKGQAGNSAFLSEFRMMLESLMKLQGLAPSKNAPPTPMGDTLIKNININLDNATPDQLLRFKVAMADLKGTTLENDPQLEKPPALESEGAEGEEGRD